MSSRWDEYLECDHVTGVLTWKERPMHHFASYRTWAWWKARFTGRKAGTKQANKNGIPNLIVVQFDRRHYASHRIVWEMVHGPIPDGMQVDHRDGNPFNNRLDNLRLATQAQNQWNKAIFKSNTTGFKGVYLDKSSGKFRAQIRANGKSEYLGSFLTAEAAGIAYSTAAERLHGEFAKT